MASDPTKPILRLHPGAPQARVRGRSIVPPGLQRNSTTDQNQRFGPQFQRLTDLLQRDPAGLALRVDPTALAPERLLVFEVKASIADFARAINKVPGLELIDEEELPDDESKAPVAYLLVPDLRALQQIESLWRKWVSGQKLPRGFTPWRDVFACLRDLRVWGPTDRVQPLDADSLVDEIEGRADDELVPLEIELVFRASPEAGATSEETVTAAVRQSGGRILSRSRLDDISYHAILAELPVASVRLVVERNPGSVAGVESIMHIRPQSVVTKIDTNDLLPAAPEHALGVAARNHPAFGPISSPFLARIA